MKKKTLLTSLLTLVMCASLIAGGTFALFTYESKTNIAITSGKVEVVATLENLTLYSPTLIAADGSVKDKTNAASDSLFANGGSAVFENGAKLTLTNVTPGDKVDFQIKLSNSSSVAIKYRTVIRVLNDNGLVSGLKVVIGNDYDGSTLYSEWAPMSVSEKTKFLDCSVELPITAGNTYQEKTCTIVFTVESIQANAETFNTVYASSQAELNTIITNSTEDTEIDLGGQTFEFPLVSMHNKNITFTGSEDAVIDTTKIDSRQQLFRGATLTFEGITVNWANNNEGYQGFANGAKKIVYKSCVISGTQFMYSDADFIDCTFVTPDGYHGYNVYGRGIGITLTFTNCDFQTGGRAIMLYADQATKVDVVLTNCTFSDNGAYDSKAKAVVETGDDADTKTSVFNITINNCKITKGFESNNSTSALWGNKDSIGQDRLNVVIDGKDVY